MTKPDNGVEILNPGSTVLEQVEGHWQKLFSVMLFKLAKTEQVSLTAGDFDAFTNAFNGEMPVLLTQGTYDTLSMKIVPMSVAVQCAEADQRLRDAANKHPH